MAFSAPDVNGVITQTGRDLNFSALTTNAGVTAIQDNGVNYYIFGQNRLIVTGTVFHNPETEVLIFSHDNPIGSSPYAPVLYVGKTPDNIDNNTGWSLAPDGNLTFTRATNPFQVGDAVGFTGTTTLDGFNFRVIAVNGTSTTIDSNKTIGIPPTNGTSNLKACYNYGNEVTVLGRTRFSTGTGLYFTGTSNTNYNQNDSSIYVTGDGLLWARGGTIVTNRVLTLSRINIDGLSVYGLRTTDTRSGATGILRNFEIYNVDITLQNWQNIQDKGYILKSAGLIEVAANPYNEFELRNFDASKNANEYDIGHSADALRPHRDWIITNSSAGSDIKGLWRSTTGSLDQKGNVFVKKEVSIKTVDSTNASISAVKVYCIDNPSPYAKNATYPVPMGGASYYQPTLSLGVLNGDGTVTYNYTVPITYAYTTDLNGNTPTFKVTTAAQILEFNSTDQAARTVNGGPYVIPGFSTTWRESDNAAPAYSDWDTNRFGGFYRVDRRSDSNTNADDFTFKFCSYRHFLSKATYPLKGFDVLNIQWLLFNDNTISQNNKTIVDAYTTIDTPQEFYDRAKSYLYNNFAGENDVIVTRDGNEIDAGAYNVEIDATASSAFAFDGTTITIKSDNFIGQIVTTGTRILSNGALYNSVPTYLDLTLQDGYISIYDNLGDIKYYTNQDQIIALPLNSTGTWTYKYAKYGFRIGDGSFVVNGTTIDISPKFTPDIYTSDVVTNVSAFTILNDIQEIYNYLSYYSTTSAAMEYPEYYLYGNTLNLLTNNLVIDSNATKVFDYDGSTFTTKSNTLTSTLLFDTIQSSNVYLSGTSTVQNVEIDATNLYDTNVINLTGLILKGTLVYNTNSPYSIFYTNCTIDKVINDPGTGAINITRINSIIYDVTDAEITTSVPISINITIPTDSYIAIYKPNGTRYYYGTGNQTLILGGADTATGTWSYTIAKYGYVKSIGTFAMDKEVSSVTNINVATLNVDPLITEPNAIVTSLYSDLNSTSKIYDYLSYFLTTSNGIDYNNGTSVASKSIGSFTFDKDLTLDSNAIDMLNVSGNIYTFKSSGLNEDVTIYVNGDFDTLNSTTLNSNVKIRANNLDSEIEFISIDEITFYSTPTDRDSNTNPGVNMVSPIIYRFKFGSTYSGVLFSGTVYYRINVAGSIILGSTTIVQYNNTLDLGTYGQLQQILNSQDVINRGVKKASVLIPHTIDI